MNIKSKLNLTRIRIMLSSQTIFIRREEWAYPFTSLLADFGGVLGLFIGFNFLMIWDIIVYFIEKIKRND